MEGKPQKKSSFLSGQATKRGGELNGCATKEKVTFFNVRKKVPMATKKRTFFCGFPHMLIKVYIFRVIEKILFRIKFD